MSRSISAMIRRAEIARTSPVQAGETFDSEWDAFFCDVIDYIVNNAIKEVGLRNYKGATGENQRCSFFTP
ncbi:hypothetical protein AB432_011460 [Brevibacillus brevis]|uniref:Uncharacterized protein n=1 Tax=Brevibacillus brevis TaxID=1393 RepID=A0A2Z4MGH8_BREBE|nr:hypothetical protein AB432_011460 [Brevibacillus brevis]